MDDAGENNENGIVKKEEFQDEDKEGEEANNDSDDDDFINRNYNMKEMGNDNSQRSSTQQRKKKEKKIDLSTVYSLNHERGTQISLKRNTLFVLKEVTVIQQNEEPPFLNISEKNIVQVVFPF